MMVALILSLLAPLHDPCAHQLGEPRPRLTEAHQAETRALIRDVVAATGGSDEFAAVLELVARRESSLQRGVVHQLPADLAGSSAAFARVAPYYAGNPAAADPTLWQTYGLFGMNSAYFTMVWNRAADPRVLCDAVVDVLVYRRAAERVLRRAGERVRCRDGSTHTLTPTWTAIHGAVSGGSLCPRERDADFRRRALRLGLDPNAPIRRRDLGREPADPALFVRSFWARWRARAS